MPVEQIAIGELEPKVLDNIAIVQAAIEQVFNQRNKAAANSYFHPAIAGTVGTDATENEKVQAFSDLTYNIDDITGQGTLVAAQYTATGTHDGFFKTAAPTGKVVSWNGTFLALVSKSLIVDFQVAEDFHRRNLQVGLIPVAPALSVSGAWRGLANDGSVEMTLNLSQGPGGTVTGTADYKSMGKTMGTAGISGTVDYPSVSLESEVGSEIYRFTGLLDWAKKSRGSLDIIDQVQGRSVSTHPVKMTRFA
jgi:predicted ester cyclase